MIYHLKNTRLSIEKFVYEKGTNVALYNVEHSKKYKSFQKAVERSLMGQIKYIADYKDTLPLLMSLAKAASEPLINQVSVLLAQVSLGNDIDLKAYLVWAGTQGGQAGLDKLGIDGIFGLKNEALINYFGNYSNLLIDQVDDYTKKWIANKIQEGKDQGKTPFEIQQSLIDDGKSITAIRAERIVLTETAKAMTKIELEVAQRTNIKRKIWRTSRDERVCPICGDGGLADREVGILESFVGGYEGPPAHVSCRCYLEEVIPEGWVIPEKVWLGT